MECSKCKTYPCSCDRAWRLGAVIAITVAAFWPLILFLVACGEPDHRTERRTSRLVNGTHQCIEMKHRGPDLAVCTSDHELAICIGGDGCVVVPIHSHPPPGASAGGDTTAAPGGETR